MSQYLNQTLILNNSNKDFHGGGGKIMSHAILACSSSLLTYLLIFSVSKTGCWSRCITDNGSSCNLCYLKWASVLCIQSMSRVTAPPTCLQSQEDVILSPHSLHAIPFTLQYPPIDTSAVSPVYLAFLLLFLPPIPNIPMNSSISPERQALLLGFSLLAWATELSCSADKAAFLSPRTDRRRKVDVLSQTALNQRTKYLSMWLLQQIELAIRFCTWTSWMPQSFPWFSLVPAGRVKHTW